MVRLLKITELDELPDHARLRLAEGLAPLLRAQSYAKFLPTDAPELTVALKDICPTALTKADCQFAAAVDLVTIRTGRSRNGSSRRVTPSNRGLRPDSVLLLSPAGAEWIQRQLASPETNNHRAGKTIAAEDTAHHVTVRAPIVYKRTRELYFRGALVIKLGSRARNTAALLSRFQKRNWRQRIRNPLRSARPQGRAQQLRDAVHDLNVLQESTCGQIYLRFHAHDKGHTLWYELVEIAQQKGERRSPTKDARRH